MRLICCVQRWCYKGGATSLHHYMSYHHRMARVLAEQRSCEELPVRVPLCAMNQQVILSVLFVQHNCMAAGATVVMIVMEVGPQHAASSRGICCDVHQADEP